MKNKKMIIALVSAGLIVLLGAGGIFVNAQIQEKEAVAESERVAESEALAESERIKESEAAAESERIAESEALAKAEKEVIEELETLISALYADDSKELLSGDVLQDKIKEVETLLAELKKPEFSEENTAKLNSLTIEFSVIKNMFSVSTSVKGLKLEVAVTDEGAKKVEEIQKQLDALKTEKPEFVKSLQETLDTIKADIAYIKNVKDSIRSLFTDDTYSTVADGVTRDAFLSVVSLKDGIGVESIRLALEEKLMVVSNYLDEKDTEIASSSSVASSDNSSSGVTNNSNASSSADTNTSSSSSSAMPNNGNTSSTTNNNNGSSAVTNNSTPETTALQETQKQPVWVVDVAAYDEPVYSIQDVYESRPVCRDCGIVFNSTIEAGDHNLSFESGHSYTIIKVVVGQEQIQVGTIHHEEQGHWE